VLSGEIYEVLGDLRGDLLGVLAVVTSSELAVLLATSVKYEQ